MLAMVVVALCVVVGVCVVTVNDGGQVKLPRLKPATREQTTTPEDARRDLRRHTYAPRRGCRGRLTGAPRHVSGQEAQRLVKTRPEMCLLGDSRMLFGQRVILSSSQVHHIPLERARVVKCPPSGPPSWRTWATKS